MLLTHAPSFVVHWSSFCQKDLFLLLPRCSIAAYLSNSSKNVKLHRVECALGLFLSALVEHAEWFCMRSAESRCYALTKAVCSHNLVGSLLMEKMFTQGLTGNPLSLLKACHLVGEPRLLLHCWPPWAGSLFKFRVDFLRWKQSNTSLLIVMLTWTRF